MGSLDIENTAVPAASSMMYRPPAEDELHVVDTTADLFAAQADAEAVKNDLAKVCTRTGGVRHHCWLVSV
jgi:hypothetical protein